MQSLYGGLILFKRVNVILLVLFMLTLSGCSENNADSEKKSVVATLFPQYDFVREIAGDKVNIKLLIAPGIETHSYEPSPKDIIDINKADLFVYTGEYMEPWAANIIKGIKNDKGLILNVSDGIRLEEEEHSESHNHSHGYDPHIWTSPVNAVAMCENILNALITVDPDNKSFYEQNAKEYIENLRKLDSDIRECVASSKRKEIVFGGRFAMQYFAEEYGITCISAYDNCSHETEPSVKDVAMITDKIRKDEIPVIYYEELVDPKVARSIANETGVEMLRMHSCHNLSKDDFENGEGYISLMNKNLENLRKGLN